MNGSTSPGKVWGPLCPALIGARNLEGYGTHEEADSKITKVRGSVEGVKACAFLLRGMVPTVVPAHGYCTDIVNRLPVDDLCEQRI